MVATLKDVVAKQVTTEDDILKLAKAIIRKRLYITKLTQAEAELEQVELTTGIHISHSQ